MIETVEKSYGSNTNQTVNNFSDLNITYVVDDHELILQEAYDDLCEKLWKSRNWTRNYLIN